MRWLIVALVSFHLPACGGAPATPVAVADPAIAELAWLSGTWYRDDAGEANEEMWSIPRGDSMIGANRTIAGGRTAYYEFLRIVATADGVFYEAWPKGQAPARFRLVESGDGVVAFEAPDHDWPQRITYRLVGDQLTATVDGAMNGELRTERWSWERIR